MDAWWASAFGPDYLALYAHRDDAQASDEVAGLAPVLGRLCTGLRLPILDAGCGGGRHLAALWALGLPAFGFDLSPGLLAAARSRPALAGRLVRGDLFAPPLAEASCAAVLLLFTTFGYGDDATNLAALGRLGRLLAPGGRLVLDLPEREHLRRNLVPETRRTLPSGQRLRERRRLAGDRVEKLVDPLDPGPVAQGWRESVRLYGQSELEALAGQAGLQVAGCWPSLRGPAVEEHRLVLWLGR